LDIHQFGGNKIEVRVGSVLFSAFGIGQEEGSPSAPSMNARRREERKIE